MTSNQEADLPKIQKMLDEFLKEFESYSFEVHNAHRDEVLNERRSQLQRKAPLVTQLILKILGPAVLIKGSEKISRGDLLICALMGGGNEDPVNFADWEAMVTSVLNLALGKIAAGLWPPKFPEPRLLIRDAVLRQRCSDLLQAPGKYDRVVREATLILEDRLRVRISHERLTALIPDSSKQAGDNLVNTLLSPSSPILSVSTDSRERAAFQRIMIGVFAYLRNPFHHHIDDAVEWSWSWSIVGFIDHLLHELDACEESK